MPIIPADMTNRRSAAETRAMLLERTFRWNQMRRTQICYNAVPSSKHGKSIVADGDVTASLEDEILEAFKWWIVDDMYWYIRECVESMGIGIYLEMDFVESDELKDVIERKNGVLHIRISTRMVMLAHTPAICDVSSTRRARAFFDDVARSICKCLEDDGYMIAARDSSGRRFAATDTVLDGMRELERVRIDVMWATMEEADQMDRLEYESQLDAVRGGVPIEDVLA